MAAAYLGLPHYLPMTHLSLAILVPLSSSPSLSSSLSPSSCLPHIWKSISELPTLWRLYYELEKWQQESRWSKLAISATHHVYRRHSSPTPSLRCTTIIVAATHPALHNTHATTSDGWFLSDFYAFNNLLEGMGHPGDKDWDVPGQVWLTATVRTHLLLVHQIITSTTYTVYDEVGTRWPDQEYLLHGNPYQTRRVVLSEPLLNSNEYTPVTIVKTSNMIDKFLNAVQKPTELAKRELPSGKPFKSTI